MAILFDLDGTLLDTSLDFHTATNLVLQAENLPTVDYACIRRNISFGSKRILEGALNFDMDHNPQHDAYLEKLLPKFLHEYAQTKFQNTKAFPGIDVLLQDLEAANLTWGIVTNKIQALTEPLLKTTGYFQRSACIVCGDTTPKAKPAPEPLWHACELLQVSPADCIFIGDSINDITAGKAAGMRTIAAAFGFIPEDVQITDWQADAIVHSPHEILPWIQRWVKPAN